MARGSVERRPTPRHRQAVRRRRTWAGLAVMLCVAADVWSVAGAGAREPATPAALFSIDRVAFAAGMAPAVAVDQVERVPDSQLGSPGDGETATGAAPTSATASKTGTPNDGKDAKGAVIESGTGHFTVVAVPAK